MDAMKLRFYVNATGIVDALEFEARKSLEVLQMEDIRQLGRLILSMATNTEITASTDAQSFANCERYFLQTYSRELHNLSLTLIRSPSPPNIVEVSRALSGRLWDEWDHTQMSLQRTERALSSEYESGRALRLLLKLGFVNERPEFGPNRRWAQSGDCYVLTLFRDYGTCWTHISWIILL
jgi:PAB-dependent poly(A)-specific ribonuclease subunit 3